MTYHCLRCQHSWPTRLDGQSPVECPRCKSYRWNIPRRGSRAMGTNQKALGTNPRARGTNPRALGTNPRAVR